MGDLSRRIGPFVLEFEPDGQDAGVGIVVLTLDSGERIETDDQVERDEWDAFTKDLDGR